MNWRVVLAALPLFGCERFMPMTVERPGAPAPITEAEPAAAPASAAAPTTSGDRMDWWRDARFGMFIHWGLYAVPAGKWGENTGHGEWIMTTAQIPVPEYEKFLGQFNPVKFDADAWAKTAKAAGMKYIVITSKHHDGFALFDSKVSDYDVMATPFRRDIMKELSDACRREGIQICWYHSIMDWHHPDYLPRRDWEDRPADGADYNRYRQYLHGQVRELLTNYGPIGVMWFDGEWESTWKHEFGVELYNLCRSIQPNVIVNNRVDVGREGMAGLTRDGGYVGDFGTPEQEIPPAGLPGVDWETCMTMNEHWGYNAADQNFKTTEDLIQKLADIASKGGNFLLNVGPTSLGEIPPTSIERLREIGAWMDVNGESIHGTSASPFPELPAWGRCTQRAMRDGSTRLYLHVFQWPEDHTIRLDGLLNKVLGASMLTSGASVPTSRDADALVLSLPPAAPDPINSVIVLDLAGAPRVALAPTIEPALDIFMGTTTITMSTSVPGAEIRYTVDGTDPTASSLLYDTTMSLDRSAEMRARVFIDGVAVSPVTARKFERVLGRQPIKADKLFTGVEYRYFEGQWDRLPNFSAEKELDIGVVSNFDLGARKRDENYAIRFRAYLLIPYDGVYTFSMVSDDGSVLYIGEEKVVDNDGLHSMREASGRIALQRGFHRINVEYFNRTGQAGLDVYYEGPGIAKRRITDKALYYRQ